MRILQVITLCELGGAQTVVVNLANKLSEHNEVIVIAGEGDGKMWPMLSPTVKIEHCPHLQRAISLKADFLAAIELRRLYRKYKPDIIHLHSSKAGILGRIVFPTGKVIYTVHGFDSVRVAFRKFLPVERMMQHFCRAVVGVSEYDHRNLISEGITKNVSTVYNGIVRPDTGSMRPIPEFEKYTKTIICIARVSPPKKVSLFVEIAKLLPEYGFIWIGNQYPVTEFNLPANCHFVGNIPNAGAYCSQADLFMLPSDYEGLPMVIIEAMSFGKPIVASAVGGVGEIVRNDENGYALENRAELFAEKIQYILSDEMRYKTFSAKSLEIFNARLTIENMVNGYWKIYNK